MKTHGKGLPPLPPVRGSSSQAPTTSRATEPATDGTHLASMLPAHPRAPRDPAGALSARPRNAVLPAGSSQQPVVQLPGVGASADASTVLPQPPLVRVRVDKLWKKSGSRQVEFEPLRQAYIRAGNEAIPGPEFLRLVHFLTTQAKAPALPTGRPGIHRHEVEIPGTAGLVQVLRRDHADGSLADLRIARSGAEADVRQTAATMQRGADKRVATRAGLLAKAGRTAGPSAPARDAAPQQTPHQRVWKARRQQLRALHTAYAQTLPGKRKFSGADFLELLEQLAGQPRASQPTNVAGIDRCLVRLPRLDQDVRFLIRRDAGGELTDLHLLTSIEEEGHVLDKMETVRKRHATNALANRVQYTREDSDSKHLRDLWDHLGPHLQAPFEAYVQRRHALHESHAGINTFVRHLDDLCKKEGGTLVNAEHGIARHVLALEGSDRPVTLLRRVSAEGALTLRHVGRGLMDEVATIRNMIGRMQASITNDQRAARAETRPAGVPPAAEPAGARARRLTRADQLTLALEAMVANKSSGKPLLEGAEQAAGVPGPTLRSWFTHEGRLRRSFDAMTALVAFFDERSAIHQHLSALGHEDQAERLPQPLSAELVAAVLQARVDHPAATNGASLARLTSGNRRVIDRTVDARTGTLIIGDHRLQHLPGYDTHWQAIRAALQALGHAERASGLPRPPTAGEQFVLALKEDLYPMAAAVSAMQAEPGLPVREAARRMSDSAEVAERLQMLVEPGGQVRSRAEVAARLPDLELHRHEELDTLLAQLKPAVPSRMRRALVPGFGHFGAKLFIVNKTDDGAGVQSTTKQGLRALYADSLDLVMPPRSFRHDRAQQALRWLSTVLKKEFKTTEVQCYFDAKRNNVWVSSNSERTNRKIQEFLASGGLKSRLEQGSANPSASREDRHQSKLARKLAEPEAGGAMAPVLKAMVAKRFRVPTEAVYQHGKVIDLHAERRIKDAFQEATGEALNRKSLAGTMRPCTVCAEDLGLPPTARRGPAWLSRAGQAFYDANEIVERNIGQAIGTYASLTRAGKLSVNYNTDSDSSDDDAAAARAPRRADPQASRASSSAPSTSLAPSMSWAVLGKRKAREPRVQPPIESREPGAAVEPRAAPAVNAANTMTELTRHLDAWNWPASPPPTTWRPASPQEPASPTGPAAPEDSPAPRPRRS